MRLMKLACELRIAVAFALANCSRLSIARYRFCQSCVLMLSTRFLISSMRPRSMGFETDVVRLLNVFCVPSKPDELPWLDMAPRCIVIWWSLNMPPPRGIALPIPLVPTGPLLPPRTAWLFGMAPAERNVFYILLLLLRWKPSLPEAP